MIFHLSCLYLLALVTFWRRLYHTLAFVALGRQSSDGVGILALSDEASLARLLTAKAECTKEITFRYSFEASCHSLVIV
jgi:hypothetical protein